MFAQAIATPASSSRRPGDMVVRVVATSFLQRGVGPYTLRIREFIGKQ